MFSVASLIAAHHGLAPTHRLLAAGVTKSALAWAVHAGVIVRVRKGWYARPDVAEILLQAARIGGRLTGPTAALLSGCWAPPGNEIHVSVSPNACRLRDRNDFRRRLEGSSIPPVLVHWTDDRRGGTPFLRSTTGWVRDAMSGLDIRFAIAVADSALRTGILDRLDWEAVRRELSLGLARQLAIVDGIPDSGTESIARWNFLQTGIAARLHAVVGGGKEVDFLIGDRLVVEIDSQAHHGSRADRLADLRRDAELAAAGYIVLRFDYLQVLYQPETMIEAVLAHLWASDHLRDRRR